MNRDLFHLPRDDMVTVFIPPVMQTLTAGTKQVHVVASTVREVVEQLDVRFPGMRDRLCEGPLLRPGLSVAIGSRIHGRSLLQEVPDGAEVHFLPAVGGG